MTKIARGGAVLVMLALLAGAASAQSAGGAACLQITPGARADGMGRAFVALPTDATANWWNPAALAEQRGHVISLMHAQLVPDLASDVYYENLGYAMNLPGWGGIGASLIYLTYGKSTAVDADGVVKGDFTSYEFSPQISIGTEIISGFSAGATLKYVNIDLAPDWALNLGADLPGGPGAGKGDSFGADLAVLLRTKDLAPSFPVPINIGVNVQNLGPKITFISADNADPMPRLLKAGIGVQFLDTPDFKGLAAYDFNKSLVYSDEKPVHNTGMELTYRDFVSGRIGYIYDKQGDIRDPTFGVGFVLNLPSLGTGGGITVDYASVPQARVLDRVNKFSLSFRF
jgi:hypothetical protein